MTLRSSPVVAVALGLLAACAAEPPPGPEPELAEAAVAPMEAADWPTYSGAWFEVDYPPEFEVRPSLASETAEGYDSVFFDSPGGGVSFYVCSPQWRRKPTDIALEEESETLVASEEEAVAGGTVRRYTIAARDGSYRREYEETELHEGSVLWAVGFRYPDSPTGEEYRPAYERFKASLRQFSD